MPLIKNGEIVADSWRRIADDEPIPGEGDVILSARRLGETIDVLGERGGRLGLTLPNTADPIALATLLKRVELVALSFPAFTDGRAYSQARVLRSELGFEGELRATGNVLADQAAFMLRVGFDSFETDGRQSIEVWLRALGAVTHVYQRGYAARGFAQRRDSRGKPTEPRDQASYLPGLGQYG